MDIDAVLTQLKNKRQVFHSEADFQIALAWEFQQQYPDASLRLEYPPPGDPQKHIDILVRHGDDVYPIELKYKKAKFRAVVNGEQYSLTDHSAYEQGQYDFVKDICRLEAFREYIILHPSQVRHTRGEKTEYNIGMKKGRKNYSAEFKTKVVLELLSGDHTLNEVAERHEISPATLCVWHKLFQERASMIFEKGPSEQDKQLSEQKEEIDALHKKVGQFTIECDWLKKNLTKSLDYRERIELVSSMQKILKKQDAY